MKRLIVVVALIFVLLFAGCYRHEPMYDQADAQRIAETGAEMMQDWLWENMPDATLEECSAYLAWTPYDGNEYLTDYASGLIRRDGEQQTFTIHTSTGAVYFEMDEETRQELNALVESYFDEALAAIGIIPESTVEGYTFSCYVMAPARVGDAAAEIPWVYAFDFGLPAEVEDLEAFVSDPQTRLPICVSKPDATVPNSTDLAIYNLAAMEKLETEYGLHIDALTLDNDLQHFSKVANKDQITVALWEYGCWYAGDGFELRGRVRNREEVLERETGELTVSDETVNPETDLLFEETDYGYRLAINNRDMADSLRIKAYAGSDILQYDYYCMDGGDYMPKKDPAETGRATVWVKLGDGSYLLADSIDASTLWMYDGDILVRKQ